MLVRRLVEGGAQLVAGVGDELSLLALGSGQSRQHGVEAAGQTGQLVVALVVDGGRKVLGGGRRARRPGSGLRPA